MKMQNKFKASGNFTDKKSQFNQSRRKLMIFLMKWDRNLNRF